MTPRGWRDTNDVHDEPVEDFYKPGMVVQICPAYAWGRDRVPETLKPLEGMLAIVHAKSDDGLVLHIPSPESPPHAIEVAWDHIEHLHWCQGWAGSSWDAREEEL